MSKKSKNKHNNDHTYDAAKSFHHCTENYFNANVDLETLKTLSKARLFLYDRFVSRPNKISAIKSASDFLKSHFKLHSVNILSNDNKSLLHKLLRNQNNDSFQEVYHGMLEQKNPLDLEYRFVELLDCQGSTEVSYPFKDCKPYFGYIGLSKNILDTKLSATAYIHEIIHTQLESQVDSYKNIYNSEILSFLCELIFSYEFSEQDKGELLSFTIKEIFDLGCDKAARIYENHKSTYVSDRVYYASIYKALNLFNHFIEMSDLDKQSMIDNIQTVFDGIIPVEMFLKFYGVNDSNLVNEDVLKLLKK